jgi:hypothetical protein
LLQLLSPLPPLNNVECWQIKLPLLAGVNLLPTIGGLEVTPVTNEEKGGFRVIAAESIECFIEGQDDLAPPPSPVSKLDLRSNVKPTFFKDRLLLFSY